jgi:hypothetical protein
VINLWFPTREMVYAYNRVRKGIIYGPLGTSLRHEFWLSHTPLNEYCVLKLTGFQNLKDYTVTFYLPEKTEISIYKNICQ